MKKRRSFTKEFKEEACKLVISEGQKISETARDLGISEGILGRWVREARYGQGPSDSSAKESKRIKELEAENKRLRMEREVLKKAITFFGEDGK